MPRYRPEIAALSPYEVGRPIEEVAREMGLDPHEIVRLTANETPFGPFPGAVDAGIEAVTRSSRYPDNDLWDLSRALADELGVERSNLMFGNGSVALLVDMVNAVGGPDTNIVYGWPSFVMYRFAAIWAGSDYREVPLDSGWSFDLEAIRSRVDHQTRAVFLCNPNNPTGTIIPGDELEDFIAGMPDSVLVIVDEAYHHFVEDERYQTAIPHALESGNVVVLRTFSKIYGLAGHRIGYAVGRSDTFGELRKAQQPLTVNTVAQAAALASLGQPEEVERRVRANAAGRHYLAGVLSERELAQIESHANFIFFEVPGGDASAASDLFTNEGVIVRPLSAGWIRVTVGSDEENRRFVSALDRVLESLRG